MAQLLVILQRFLKVMALVLLHILVVHQPFSDILGIPAATSTANTFGNVAIYIPNYTSSNNKSISVDGVGENNATTAFADLYAGLWANSSAITSITLYNIISDFAEFSTATLYGIKNS
jgi:hypothetical protein